MPYLEIPYLSPSFRGGPAILANSRIWHLANFGNLLLTKSRLISNNLTGPPPSQKNTVMAGLLNTCVQTLHSQGMRRMFLDGVAANEVEFFKSLGQFLAHPKLPLYRLIFAIGFEEWAQYRDVWKDV